MCLLILKPAGIRLPSAEEVRRAWTRNRDGGGFSFREPDGTLTLCKGIFCVDSMIASMNEHLTPAMEVVIHLRYSTHSGDKIKNCHPHRIGDGHLGVCSHNGVIDVPHRKGESDTRAYIRQIIEPLMREANGKISKTMARVIGRDIGTNNKLVITPAEGPSVIVNEESGVWQDGLWWSNSSAFPPAPAPDPARTMGYSHWSNAPAQTSWNQDHIYECKECSELMASTDTRWRGGKALCVECALKEWAK